MNGAAAAPAVLCAAQGLAWAFVPRASLASCAGWFAAAFAIASAARPAIAESSIVLACWIGAAAYAASVNLPRAAIVWLVPILALNAGLCCAAVHAESWLSLAWTLMAIPAIWALNRGAGIAVKVVSSWLLVVALLIAALSFLPVTPGYLPDHLE